LALAEIGFDVSVAELQCFVSRLGITRKNWLYAFQQDRPNVLRKRQRWFEAYVSQIGIRAARP